MNRRCKCTDCGYVFDYEDAKRVIENHWLDGEYMGYETFLECPECGGYFEDATDCRECGETFAKNELYEGWCEECLRETINYDTFFEYCEENKDHQYLDIFVMQNFFDMDCPNNITYEFHQLMIEEYKRTVRFVEYYKKVLNKKPCYDFLDKCIRFIMDDNGSIGRENYADWLNKREVK